MITSDSFASSAFFSRLKEDFDAGHLGWIGDFRDFGLGYLTFASTLLAHVEGSHSRPVGAVVLGESSTGKTELANSLMKLFPDDHVISVTSMSTKSLIYRCIENPTCLHGKVVFVEELSGLRNEDLQYMLRILVTRGEVRHVSVVNGKAVEIHAKGYISLQTTGLPTDKLRDDTMNRLVTISSDASPQMTARVIDQIKSRYSNIQAKVWDSDDIAAWYKRFFAGLNPLRVLIPFAAELPLSGLSPDSRRLAKIAMDLLCTVTLLNQEDRVLDSDRGVLLAEREDFDILREFMRDQIDRGRAAMTTRERIVLEALSRIAHPDTFTYDEVAALRPGEDIGVQGGYSMTSIKYAMDGLLAKGYVAVKGKNGRTKIFCRGGHSLNEPEMPRNPIASSLV